MAPAASLRHNESAGATAANWEFVQKRIRLWENQPCYGHFAARLW